MSSQGLAAPLQACGSKLAPTAEPLSGDGGGRGGAYVHTSLETSSPTVFVGSTIGFLEKARKRKKVHTLLKLDDSLKAIGREDERKSLWCCGRYFRYGVWKNCPAGPSACLLGFRCKSVFCPDCARLRARPYQTRIWNVVKVDKTNYFHMVFTLETHTDVPLTRETINRMIHAFRHLREEEEWSEWIEGGFYSIEAVYNTGKEPLGNGKFATRGWHPHIHVLMKSKGWLPDEWLGKIKRAWLRLTGDSDYVHIERVFALDARGNKKMWRINEKAIREIVKYSTKAAKFCDEPHLVGEFLDAFKNVRRLQAFGSFVGIAKKAEAEGNAELEPEKGSGAAQCKCGLCKWSQLVLFPDMIHISNTVLLPSGERVLKDGYSPPDEVRDMLLESETEMEFESRQKRLLSMEFVAASLPFDSANVVQL